MTPMAAGPRIAIGSIFQESNHFAAARTDLALFQNTYVLEGAELELLQLVTAPAEPEGDRLGVRAHACRMGLQGRVADAHGGRECLEPGHGQSGSPHTRKPLPVDWRHARRSPA